MKKHKVYLGKRKVAHREGMVCGRWVVPSVLREYFSLRFRLQTLYFSLKISMNARVGLGMNNTYAAIGVATRKIITPAEAEQLPVESKDYYTECMQHRHKIAVALGKREHYSIQKLQVIHDEATSFFNSPQAEAA